MKMASSRWRPISPPRLRGSARVRCDRQAGASGSADRRSLQTSRCVLRRIRPIADQEELKQALAFPWEKWGVFLRFRRNTRWSNALQGPRALLRDQQEPARPSLRSIERCGSPARIQPQRYCRRVFLSLWPMLSRRSSWSWLLKQAASCRGSRRRRFAGLPSKCISSNMAYAPALRRRSSCASGCVPPLSQLGSKAFLSASCYPSGPMLLMLGACHHWTPIRPSNEWAARAGLAPISARAYGPSSPQCMRRWRRSVIRLGPTFLTGLAKSIEGRTAQAIRPYRHRRGPGLGACGAAVLRGAGGRAERPVLVRRHRSATFSSIRFRGRAREVDVRGRSQTLKVCYRTATDP